MEARAEYRFDNRVDHLSVAIHFDIDETLLLRGECAHGTNEFLAWLVNTFNHVEWCTYWTQRMNREQLNGELEDLGLKHEILEQVRWSLWEQLRIETAVPNALNIYIDDTQPLSGVGSVDIWKIANSMFYYIPAAVLELLANDKHHNVVDAADLWT